VRSTTSGQREDAAAHNPLKQMEAAPRFEPGNNGFAEREAEKDSARCPRRDSNARHPAPTPKERERSGFSCYVYTVSGRIHRTSAMPLTSCGNLYAVGQTVLTPTGLTERKVKE